MNINNDRLSSVCTVDSLSFCTIEPEHQQWPFVVSLCCSLSVSVYHRPWTLTMTLSRLSLLLKASSSTFDWLSVFLYHRPRRTIVGLLFLLSTLVLYLFIYSFIFLPVALEEIWFVFCWTIDRKETMPVPSYSTVRNGRLFAVCSIGTEEKPFYLLSILSSSCPVCPRPSTENDRHPKLPRPLFPCRQACY